MKLRKVLSVVLTVCMITAASSIAFSADAKNPGTVTVNNEADGIEFSIDKGWKNSTVKGNKTIVASFTSPEKNSSIKLEVDSTAPDMIIEKYTDLSIKKTKAAFKIKTVNNSYTTGTNKKLKSANITYQYLQNKTGTKVYQYIFKYDKKYYVFTYSSLIAKYNGNFTVMQGVIKSIKLTDTAAKVKKEVEGNLKLAIGEICGKAGETVTIPVSFQGVSPTSVGTCNFYVSFDSNVLEPVEITAGDIVVNPNTNFNAKISNGNMSFLFLDNTIGQELITKDGVYANIKIKIKSTAAVGATPLKLQAVGAFGDKNMKKITGVSSVDGSVTVTP